MFGIMSNDDDKDFGIVIFIRDEQFSNIFSPTWVRVFGITILVRDSHPEKA